MARSQNDIPTFEDIENHWSYQRTSSQVNSKPHQEGLSPQLLMPEPRMMTDNVNRNNFTPDVFHPDIAYNTGNNVNVHRNSMGIENIHQNDNQGVYHQPISHIPVIPNYSNRPADTSNSKVVRVYYNENNQPHFILPVNNYDQYELFSTSPHQMSQYNNGDFNSNNIPPTADQYNNMRNPIMHHTGDRNNVIGNQHLQDQPATSSGPTNLFDHLLGNCISGYWAPFGSNYTLDPQKNLNIGETVNQTSVQQLRNFHTESNNVNIAILTNTGTPMEPLAKRTEFGSNSEVISKPRAVAEVKPMRPSYSDVLVKHSAKEKIVNKLDNLKKSKCNIVDVKPIASKSNTTKQEKSRNQSRFPLNNEEKFKCDSVKSNFSSQLSSGSDSGDTNIEQSEIIQKSSKSSKGKESNVRRKWSSLDNLGESDINNPDDSLPFNSDFVFVPAEEATSKRGMNKKTQIDKSFEKQDNFNWIENSDDIINDDADFESQQETLHELDKIKTRKAKEGRFSNNTKIPPRPGSDKKKLTQNRSRKFKRHGYFGIVQSFLNKWITYVMKFLLWIWNLVSDILSMSAHLSFDFLSVACTQGYDYSQAIWKSIKLYLAKATNGKMFSYIDKKFGHTKFGFWRKMQWFKKHVGREKPEEEDSEPVKNNKNIPLPATGDEAMKRLFACKGKDPYSILGVSVKCTDEEIKRYYRKQAFLVHPDKNTTPGAEEAFKILQHAFDLIGEPERRSAYDRRILESHHMEAAWSELNDLLAQLHEKMEFAASTIRCTNCGRRHKRVLTDRPCYAARACSQCKIRHSAKEGDIWAESGFWGLILVFYACMDGAVYQITPWASCQKKNLKHLRPDCHVVQYRIVLGNKAGAGVGSGNPGTNSNGSGNTPTGSGPNSANTTGGSNSKHHSNNSHESLDDFLSNLYSKSGQSSSANNKTPNTSDQHDSSKIKRRNRKGKV